MEITKLQEIISKHSNISEIIKFLLSSDKLIVSSIAKEKLSNTKENYEKYLNNDKEIINNFDQIKDIFSKEITKLHSEIHWISGHSNANFPVPVTSNPNKPKGIYILVSNEDETCKQKLIKHLTVTLNNKIQILNEKGPMAGSNAEAEIRDQILPADIIICLVSIDSLSSETINQVHLPVINQIFAGGKDKVFSVILGFCSWENSDFKKFITLPSNGEPVLNTKEWINEDQAWKSVVESIQKIHFPNLN